MTFLFCFEESSDVTLSCTSFSLIICRVFVTPRLNLTAENGTVKTADDRSVAGDPNPFPLSIPATLTLKLKSD